MENYTSPAGIIMDEAKGQKTYTGDLLENHREHMRKGMFHGFDFDATMLRIAAMNLLLHGVDAPDIHYQDTLSNSFPERFPGHANHSLDIGWHTHPSKAAWTMKTFTQAFSRT